MLRPGEAARMLGVSPLTVSSLYEAGKLEGYRIPAVGKHARGHLRVYRSSVVALLESRGSIGAQ